MIKVFQEWAKREYSLRQRLIALGFEAVLFVIVLPYLLVVSAAAVDHRLGLPRFTIGAANWLVGLALIVGGGFLALWSIQTQLTIGRGTPAPMMPTQKLIVKGPFAYCRNPMALGTVVAFAGICVWIGSFAALAVVLAFTALLLLYVKLIEEKELEARFGAEYQEYKRRTPFLIPRRRR